MQSRDWRLLIAQVQREARELPVRTSIDKLAKVIGEKLKFVGEENQYRTWESGGRNKAGKKSSEKLGRPAALLCALKSK